ncbi:hypothetical protein Scep_011829 [Stephania cephalantha]|uniref:Uncharacterized protein n=1 Tax=Stephania cephalantha TaxID=152367 RepID=A0AAP0JFH9_9MAGN
MNGEPLRDIERNMISDWLSQSTTRATLAGRICVYEIKVAKFETQVTAILEHLMDEEEFEKEIEVISKRSEEPREKRTRKTNLSVLVKPPTLPCIFVRPCKGVDVKERSQIFYTADTFVLDDHDSTDSFVLEVPNELPILKEGVHDALPKYVDAPFVVDISKGEGIT